MRNKSNILTITILVLFVGLIASLIVLKNQTYTPDDSSIEVESQTITNEDQPVREVARVTPSMEHKANTQAAANNDDAVTEQVNDSVKSQNNTEEIQELTDDATQETESTKGTESASVLSGNYIASISKKAENQVSVSILKEETVTRSIAETVYPGSTFQSDNGVTYKVISLSDYLKAVHPQNPNTNAAMSERELNDYLVKNYRCPLPTVICTWKSKKETRYGVFTTSSFYGKLLGQSLYGQSTAEDIKDGKYGICNLNISSEDAKNRNVLFGTDNSTFLTCTDANLLDGISFSKTYLGLIIVEQNNLLNLQILK